VSNTPYISFNHLVYRSQLRELRAWTVHKVKKYRVEREV